MRYPGTRRSVGTGRTFIGVIPPPNRGLSVTKPHTFMQALGAVQTGHTKKLLSQSMRAARSANKLAHILYFGYKQYKLLENVYRPAQQGGYDWTGWTELWSCPSAGTNGMNKNAGQLPCGYVSTKSLSSWLAGLDQFKIYNYGSYKNYHARMFDLSYPHANPNYWHWSSKGEWRKTVYTGDPEPELAFLSGAPVRALPAAPVPKEVGQMLTLDPMLQDPLGETPQKEPLPYGAIPSIRPNPNYIYQHERGNSPPMYGSVAPVRPFPQLDEVYYAEPPVAVYTGKTTPKLPTFHKLRPPARGVKEKKVKVTGAARVALNIASSGTEALDIVTALYNNIPRNLRVKYKNTGAPARVVPAHVKLQYIYKHYDKIDIVGAVHQIILDQFEDYIYGKIGKAGGDTSRALGRAQGAGLNTILGNLPY